MGSSGIKSSERDDKNGCMRVVEMGKKGEQEVEKMNIMRQIFYSIRNKFNENFYFLLFTPSTYLKIGSFVYWNENGMKKELLPLPQLYRYQKAINLDA